MEDVKSSRDGQVKELIAIRENERGEQLVSARELHRFLGIATRFNDWIENRIKKYEFTAKEGCEIIEFSSKE